MSTSATIPFADFLKVDVRVGRVVDVRPFPAARKPAYQLEVDFGPAIGRRRSSAQLTERYQADELLGRQVLAVVNFPPRQIATFFSEVLVLGVPDADGNVVLIEPTTAVPLGVRLFSGAADRWRAWKSPPLQASLLNGVRPPYPSR